MTDKKGFADHLLTTTVTQADREAAASVAVLPELLPCPFCGGEAESDLSQPFRHYYTGEPLSQPAVYCTVCSAQIAHYPGDVDLSRDETMDLALTAWNTRADSHHRLVEALRAAIGAIEDDTGLDEAICCSGHDCGCRGSSHRQLLLHNLTAALKEAGR